MLSSCLSDFFLLSSHTVNNETSTLRISSRQPHLLRSLPFQVSSHDQASSAQNSVSRKSWRIAAVLLIGLTLGSAALARDAGATNPSEANDNRLEAAYLFALAKMQADESSFREAQRSFERSLELDSSDPYIYVELARLHEESAQMARSAEKRRENLAQAAEYMEQARAADPESLDILRAYAEIYMRLGEHQLDAINNSQEAYEVLREKTEGDLVALTSLAQIYLWKREPAKAAEVLEEAASYMPGHRTIQAMLADALLSAGETEKAEEAFSVLSEIVPGDLQNAVRLAELRSELGDHRGAVEALLPVSDQLDGRPRIRQLFARELHLAGDNNEAMAIVSELMENDKEDSTLERLRVSVLRSMARYEDSLAALETLLSREDPTAQDSFLLIWLLERVGRVEEAIEELRILSSVAEDQEATRLALELTTLFRRQQRFDEAEQILREQMVGASPRLRTILAANLAELFVQADKPDEAGAVLNEAIDAFKNKDNERRQALELQYLFLLSENERWDELADRAGVVMTSDNPQVSATARQLYSEALAGLGQLEEALAALEVDTDGDGARRLFAQRVDLLFRHDETAADEVLKSYAESGEADDVFFAARLYQGGERYPQAIELVENYLVNDPESVPALFLLAAAQERDGRRDEASATFERLLSISPDHTPSLNYLGYMWAEDGRNLDQALELILRAVASEPDNGAYVDSLGWVYFQLGRYDEALMHLEWASRLAPGDPTVLEHLGDAYFKLENLEAARSSYQQAVELDGDNREQVQRKLDELEQGL